MGNSAMDLGSELALVYCLQCAHWTAKKALGFALHLPPLSPYPDAISVEAPFGVSRSGSISTRVALGMGWFKLRGWSLTCVNRAQTALPRNLIKLGLASFFFLSGF